MGTFFVLIFKIMESRYEQFKMRKGEKISANNDEINKSECIIQSNSSANIDTKKNEKNSVRNSILKAIFVKF